MTTAAAPRAISGTDKALMYALSGLARSGATRSNYVSTQAFLSIGGIWTGASASRRVLIHSLTIHDLLNETPNTCTFTVQGDRPMEGAEVIIAYGSKSNDSGRLFAGNILRVTEIYVGQKPSNVLWQVECIDYTWRLNSRLVVARYLTTNAATIATDLVARFAPAGFTVRITETLPVLDEISFTNTPLMEAMTQIAARIGGYAQCDYQRVVTIWLTESGQAPTPLTADHGSLEDIAYTRDLSQIVTRAVVEGGGVNMLADVGPGTPILPVEEVTWYSPGGGLVTCGPQRISYAGVVVGGAGALVEVSGAAVVPSVAPSYSQAQGAGLPVGEYRYAYTWTTVAGETTVSPFVIVNLSSLANPPLPPAVSAVATPGSLDPASIYTFAYQYAQDDATPPVLHTDRSGETGVAMNGQTAVSLRVYYSADSAVKWIHVVRRRTPGGGGLEQLHYSHRVQNMPALGGQSSLQTVTGPTDAVVGGQPAFVGGNTSTGQGAAITLTGIQTGPGGTTGRKVYRTAAGATQLKLHTTIANNTSTSIAVDTTADGALGANAPASNTAGLTGTSGVVVANATSIPVTSTAAFPTSGWARIGPQMIRYVGKTASALTGIPPYGSGSLTATIQHGTEVLVAPQLVGLPAPGQPGCVLVGIKAGDPVNLLVIVDDPLAQEALAALLGGDGLIEGVLIDNRISQTEALARADALLAQKKDPQEMVRYRCRDPLTRSGATITVDLPAPVGMVGTFKIQDVTISRFMGTNHYPVYDAVASTARFTFEDLLRQARTRTRTQPS